MTSSIREYFLARKGVAGLISFVCLALSLFHLYTAFFGSLDALLQRSIHLGLALVLVFLSRPLGRAKGRKKWRGAVNVSALLASIVGVGYVYVQYEWITAERFTLITPMSALEIVLAVITIIVLFEATRRVVGLSLVFVVLAFLLYPFLGPYLPGILYSAPISLMELLDFQYLGLSGIFGIPLGVSATEIALFIIFASVITRTGIAVLLNDFASALTGKYRGGPAKIAVVASSLMGTITGSSTANVVAVGSITIPMMKKAGYSPCFAGAVEAAASTGGQIMPPVMGAAAFVMAAFTGIPYITITYYAIFPAILYYAALMIMIHLEAVRHNLPGIKSKVSPMKTLHDYGHMVIPVIVLILLMVIGYTPRLSASVATLAALVFSQFRKTTRLSIAGMLEALEDGAKGLLIVALATAAAGVIVGVIDLTGLGQRFGSGLMALAGGRLVPALVLTMILAIILGMGMPTTAAYVIQASTVIPALIYMGVPDFAAHMFSFYYACLSLITPPVAITAYAAAGIAGSGIWETGWTAFRLGIAGYIVPFMFIYGPSLLLVGTWGQVLMTATTALIGVGALAIASTGYFLCNLTIPERIIAGSAAVLLIAPSVNLIIPGLALLAALYVIQYKRRQRLAAQMGKEP
jgi:TRAP transporter 4TM/12TM fusion protein